MFKRFLLGSAAAVVAVTGAQAADLPVAEPVEYVRICDTYGTGFFYIPGTETCLRISGFVRADYRFRDRGHDGAKFEMRARARLNFDARTATEFGTLRSYIRFRMTETGNGQGGNVGVDLEKAFVQFAGVTAGATSSFFDFWTGYSTYVVFQPFISDAFENLLLGYSFDAGNGVSINVAIEENDTTSGYNSGTHVRVITGGEAGQIMPDVVANIRVDQGWGSAQIMGAVTQLRSTLAAGDDTDYGFAIGAGVEAKLPFAAGGAIALQGAWAEGATSYVTNDGPFLGTLSDGEVIGGNIRTATAYAIAGGFQVKPVANVTIAIDGGYLNFDAPTGAAVLTDFDAYQVLGSVFYSPVSDLVLGAMVGYENVDIAGGADVDQFEGLFRIQRNF